MLAENQFMCLSCEAEFQLIHDEIDDPQYCPFCGTMLSEAEDTRDDEDKYEDDE